MCTWNFLLSFDCDIFYHKICQRPVVLDVMSALFCLGLLWIGSQYPWGHRNDIPSNWHSDNTHFWNFCLSLVCLPCFSSCRFGFGVSFNVRVDFDACIFKWLFFNFPSVWLWLCRKGAQGAVPHCIIPLKFPCLPLLLNNNCWFGKSYQNQELQTSQSR